MVSRWRILARDVIRDVIKNNPNTEYKELKKKISEAYPFGLREMHPYKIWLDEVKYQLGEKKRKTSQADNPQQITMF